MMAKRKWAKPTFITAVIVVLLCVAGYWVWTISGNQSANRIIESAKIKAVQWGLDTPPSQFLPKFTATQTGYPIYLAHKKFYGSVKLLLNQAKIKKAGRPNLDSKYDSDWFDIENLQIGDLTKLQTLLAPAVAQYQQASELPYCTMAGATVPTDPFGFAYKGWTNAKTAAKVVMTDAYVKLRKNDPDGFGKDISSIIKISNQIDEGRTILAYLIGESVFANAIIPATIALRMHPGEAAWATQIQNALKTYQEPSLFATSVSEWFALKNNVATIHKSSTREVVHVLTSTEDEDDSNSNRQARMLYFGPNMAKLVATLYANQLAISDAERYQYCSPEQWQTEISKAKAQIDTDDSIHQLASNLTASSDTLFDFVRRNRLITNLLLAFTQASIDKNKTGKWPNELVFPTDSIAPDAAPKKTVQSAVARPFFSEIDPFTNGPIQFIKEPDGFALIAEYPEKLTTLDPIKQDNVHQFLGPGKFGYVIQVLGNKVITYNFFPRMSIPSKP